MSLTTTTELDRAPALDPAIIDRFRQQGHVVTRAALPREEALAWHPVIGAAVESYKERVREGIYRLPLEQRDTYTRAFVQIENLWVQEESIRPFTLARRFGRMAAELLGAEGVRIYHDQALFKEGHGGYTPWHQDQYYWPFASEKTLTMWMPLADVGCEAGTLVFADGSHREGPLGEMEISDHSEAHFREQVRRMGLSLSTAELAAGDATWHYGWTLHKAPGNSLDTVRPVMTIIFFADGTPVAEPRNERQASDLKRWLGGRQPGELADSEMNPLVWHRSWEE